MSSTHQLTFNPSGLSCTCFGVQTIKLCDCNVVYMYVCVCLCICVVYCVPSYQCGYGVSSDQCGYGVPGDLSSFFIWYKLCPVINNGMHKRERLCCKDYSWLVQIDAVLQGLFVARTDRSCAARTVCGSYRSKLCCKDCLWLVQIDAVCAARTVRGLYRSMLHVLQGLFVARTDRCCVARTRPKNDARDREFPPPLRFLYSKMATSSTSRETVAKSVPFGDFCLVLEKISTTKGNDKKKGLLKKFIDRWRDGHRSLYGEGHASSANVRALVHMQ